MSGITVSEALSRLIEHREIFHDEMLSLFRRLMGGELTAVQIAALTVALRVKKETIGEIAAAAQVMRELATPVEVGDTDDLLDLCGTGGDGAQTFNISTAAMFVAAAAGARIAKHGGRSVSSASGSADVLEALGAAIELTPQQVSRCLDETGIGFMFAPRHHQAMKHAAPVRRELGIRTIFNILGPLTNPAGAKRQLMGVFHRDLVGIQARVLQRLGSSRALIVHGEDGLDEISLQAPTLIAELVDDSVREYVFTPEDAGLQRCSPEQTHAELQVNSVSDSRQRVHAVLTNTAPSAARDIVLLNAGAALYISGRAGTIADGVDLARQQIASGAAYRKLEQFIERTQTLSEKTP
jgi:anthranilate phosphoribosyltransferase